MKEKLKFGIATKIKENNNKENCLSTLENESVTSHKSKKTGLWKDSKKDLDYCFQEESIDGDKRNEKDDKKYKKQKEGFKRRRSNTTDFNMLYMRDPKDQTPSPNSRNNFLQKSQNFFNKLGRNLSPIRTRREHSNDSDGSSNAPLTPPSGYKNTIFHSPSKIPFKHNIFHSPFKKVPRSSNNDPTEIIDDDCKNSTKQSAFFEALPSHTNTSSTHQNVLKDKNTQYHKHNKEDTTTTPSSANPIVPNDLAHCNNYHSSHLNSDIEMKTPDNDLTLIETFTTESPKGESYSILSHELALNYIKNKNTSKHKTTAKTKLKSKKTLINDSDTLRNENAHWGISIEREDEELPTSLKRQSTTISSPTHPLLSDPLSQHHSTNLRRKSLSSQNLPATDSPSSFNYFSSSLLRKMARSSSKCQDKAKPVDQSCFNAKSGKDKMSSACQVNGGLGRKTEGRTSCRELKAILPIIRSPNKTLEKPLGQVFLTFQEETKRSILPNEVTSLDTVKALFVRSFPRRLSMASFENPYRKIYILDRVTNTFYELDDLREIVDRCQLKLVDAEIHLGRNPSMVQSAESQAILNLFSSSPSSNQQNKLQPCGVHCLHRHSVAHFPSQNDINSFCNNPMHNSIFRNNNNSSNNTNTSNFTSDSSTNYNVKSERKMKSKTYDSSGTITPSTVPVLESAERDRLHKMESQLASLSAIVESLSHHNTSNDAIINKGNTPDDKRANKEPPVVYRHKERNDMRMLGVCRRVREVRRELQIIRELHVAFNRQVQSSISFVISHFKKKPSKHFDLSSEDPWSAQCHFKSMQILNSLRELECVVEDVRMGVVLRRCRVRRSEVEHLTKLLNTYTHTLSSINRSIEERLVQDDVEGSATQSLDHGLLRQESSRLEKALRLCERLSNTLDTLLRLAGVQDKRPMALIRVGGCSTSCELQRCRYEYLQQIISLQHDSELRVNKIKESLRLQRCRRRVENAGETLAEYLLKRGKHDLRKTPYLRQNEERRIKHMILLFLQEQSQPSSNGEEFVEVKVEEIQQNTNLKIDKIQNFSQTPKPFLSFFWNKKDRTTPLKSKNDSSIESSNSSKCAQNWHASSGDEDNSEDSCCSQLGISIIRTPRNKQLKTNSAENSSSGNSANSEVFALVDGAHPIVRQLRFNSGNQLENIEVEQSNMETKTSGSPSNQVAANTCKKFKTRRSSSLPSTTVAIVANTPNHPVNLVASSNSLTSTFTSTKPLNVSRLLQPSTLSNIPPRITSPVSLLPCEIPTLPRCGSLQRPKPQEPPSLPIRINSMLTTSPRKLPQSSGHQSPLYYNLSKETSFFPSFKSSSLTGSDKNIFINKTTKNYINANNVNIHASPSKKFPIPNGSLVNGKLNTAVNNHENLNGMNGEVSNQNGTMSMSNGFIKGMKQSGETMFDGNGVDEEEMDYNDEDLNSAMIKFVDEDEEEEEEKKSDDTDVQMRENGESNGGAMRFSSDTFYLKDPFKEGNGINGDKDDKNAVWKKGVQVTNNGGIKNLFDKNAKSSPLSSLKTSRLLSPSSSNKISKLPSKTITSIKQSPQSTRTSIAKPPARPIITRAPTKTNNVNVKRQLPPHLKYQPLSATHRPKLEGGILQKSAQRTKIKNHVKFKPDNQKCEETEIN